MAASGSPNFPQGTGGRAATAGDWSLISTPCQEIRRWQESNKEAPLRCRSQGVARRWPEVQEAGGLKVASPPGLLREHLALSTCVARRAAGGRSSLPAQQQESPPKGESRKAVGE